MTASQSSSVPIWGGGRPAGDRRVLDLRGGVAAPAVEGAVHGHGADVLIARAHGLPARRGGDGHRRGAAGGAAVAELALGAATPAEERSAGLEATGGEADGDGGPVAVVGPDRGLDQIWSRDRAPAGLARLQISVPPPAVELPALLGGAGGLAPGIDLLPVRLRGGRAGIDVDVDGQELGGAGRAGGQLIGVVAAEAGEGAVALHGAGVGVAGADAGPGAAEAHRGRQGLSVGEAEPELAEAARAPAPEGASGLDAAGVAAAGGDALPVLGGAGLHGRGLVRRDAVAEAAAAAVAEAHHRAVLSASAGVISTRGDLGITGVAAGVRITHLAGRADAGERSLGVHAGGGGVTIVDVLGALVDVDAGRPIADEAGVAHARRRGAAARVRSARRGAGRGAAAAAEGGGGGD